MKDGNLSFDSIDVDTIDDANEDLRPQPERGWWEDLLWHEECKRRDHRRNCN